MVRVNTFTCFLVEYAFCEYLCNGLYRSDDHHIIVHQYIIMNYNVYVSAC